MHDRKCRLRVNFQFISIIITFINIIVNTILIIIIIVVKKSIVSIVSYSINAHLDNYNKKMSRLKE